VSKKLSSSLFRCARLTDNVESCRCEKCAVRRTKNVVVGRAMGKAGIWSQLWGGKR
jgi:hypothetical protein